MEEFIKDGYKAFSEMIVETEFNKHIERMEEQGKRRFLRASLVYQRAMKCKTCDSDVRIALMCSAVEVVSGGESVIFKDWLIHNRLCDLKNKDEKQIEKSLNRAYQDFVSAEKNREGISYNFRKFLIDYCPNELRKPPIKVYKGKGDEFEIAVRAIYSSFRSLYLHKGKGYASIGDKPYVDKETGEPVHMIAIPLLLESNGDIISVEITKITDWFADIARNSMLRYLVDRK